MIILKRLQDLADLTGVAGEIVKNNKGYWLKHMPYQEWQDLTWIIGDEPYFLGEEKNRAEKSLQYLAHLVTRNYEARTEQPELDQDPERKNYQEQLEWENWFWQTSSLS
jgi:hypothetical protein